MAADLELSEAYLSALEHGHRGRPTEALLVQICDYFNLIWADFEEMPRLAACSPPRATVATTGLRPAPTAPTHAPPATHAPRSPQAAEALLVPHHTAPRQERA